MDEPLVFEHALTHGISEEDILHAWRNAIDAVTVVRKDGNVDYVAVGPDRSGRLVEMVAREKTWGLLIYHANTPPTPRARRELGIEEG